MQRRDRRLELVGARVLVVGGSLQQQPPFIDERSIPAAPVLLVEQYELAIRSISARSPKTSGSVGNRLNSSRPNRMASSASATRASAESGVLPYPSLKMR